jgi:hypothetical protein
MSYGLGRTAEACEGGMAGWTVVTCGGIYVLWRRPKQRDAGDGMRVQERRSAVGHRRRSSSKIKQARCMHSGKTPRRTTMVSVSPSPVHSARRP